MTGPNGANGVNGVGVVDGVGIDDTSRRYRCMRLRHAIDQKRASTFFGVNKR